MKMTKMEGEQRLVLLALVLCDEPKKEPIVVRVASWKSGLRRELPVAVTYPKKKGNKATKQP